MVFIKEIVGICPVINSEASIKVLYANIYTLSSGTITVKVRKI